MPKIFWILLILAVAGCASVAAYKEIQKDNGHDNERTFTATAGQLQKALAKALLFKQFTIDKQDEAAGTVVASRYFARARHNTVVVLQARMFAQGQDQQQLFLNGIETTQRNYIVDRTRFLLFLIPLPGGGGKEVTKTKESEATIEDKSFYNDLFDAIEKNLK